MPSSKQTTWLRLTCSRYCAHLGILIFMSKPSGPATSPLKAPCCFIWFTQFKASSKRCIPFCLRIKLCSRWYLAESHSRNWATDVRGTGRGQHIQLACSTVQHSPTHMVMLYASSMARKRHKIMPFLLLVFCRSSSHMRHQKQLDPLLATQCSAFHLPCSLLISILAEWMLLPSSAFSAS